MNPPSIELCSDDECLENEAFLVDRIYEFNANATSYFDAKPLGGRMRNESGDVIAAFNGYTWGGCCVIDHLWVDESQRDRGIGRLLMQAAEAEAARRGCEQVVLSTHTFQSPAFYEKLGYERRAIITGQPKGHANLIYAKHIGGNA